MTALHSKAYKDLAKRLKLARVEAEMTQSEAAQALGKSQSFISDCERRERRIDIFELVAFSKLYCQPLTYFVPGLADKSVGS